MVSFKYNKDIDHDQLIEIAKRRVAKGHLAVVANRGEETGPNGEQTAYIVSKIGTSEQLVGKPGIARAVADFLERELV